MLYTLINLLLLPQSCWETKADFTMPGQAVSPQAVDTAPTDQIKKTQLRRPDTGSLSTQLSRQTHTVAHIQTHTPSALLFSFSLPLSDTLHTSASRTVSNYHLIAALPGQTIQLCCPPSLFLIALTLCHSNWLSGLQYPSFPCVTDRSSIHPITQRKWGECSRVHNNKGAWGGKEWQQSNQHNCPERDLHPAIKAQ